MARKQPSSPGARATMPAGTWLIAAGGMLDAIGISALVLGQHIGFVALILLGGLLFGFGVLRLSRSRSDR